MYISLTKTNLKHVFPNTKSVQNVDIFKSIQVKMIKQIEVSTKVMTKINIVNHAMY